MAFHFILLLAVSFVDSRHAEQAGGGTLLMQLSGSEVDEGNYRQTALLTFEEFDEKCKLHRAGTVKLNKKTRAETRPIVPGKPVMVSCFYTDQRTRYGRDTCQQLPVEDEILAECLARLQAVAGNHIAQRLRHQAESDAR